MIKPGSIIRMGIMYHRANKKTKEINLADRAVAQEWILYAEPAGSQKNETRERRCSSRVYLQDCNAYPDI